MLQRLGINIDDFATVLPPEVDHVVYTAAHQAGLHPQVQAAVARGIPTLSHAQALAEWFNQKKGIAVCGVGGKSTISAMISWILEQAQQHPSYAVGVGDIIGLGRTGKWDEEGSLFVAEADEYVTDPIAVQNGAELIPRFQYLKPRITVTSTISFDHPDVYKDEAHTRNVFTHWFKNLPADGILIPSDENRAWLEQQQLAANIIWYGSAATSDFRLKETPSVTEYTSTAHIEAHSQSYSLSLKVPGTYNMLNALAAISAVEQVGIPVTESIRHLATFSSTKRRFEYVGRFNRAECYDDYAHHPREIAVVLEAARQWFGSARIVVAFQPHTFSRTKALFDEFVSVLGSTPELVLLDIFASAREVIDPTISSDRLCDALTSIRPEQSVRNLHTVTELASYCRKNLKSGDVLLTLGAGDIYKVYAELGVTHE
jgi:UDP-N-acetylmuramate--alanine ligase